jgi:hypothetical protein
LRPSSWWAAHDLGRRVVAFPPLREAGLVAAVPRRRVRQRRWPRGRDSHDVRPRAAGPAQPGSIQRPNVGAQRRLHAEPANGWTSTANRVGRKPTTYDNAYGNRCAQPYTARTDGGQPIHVTNVDGRWWTERAELTSGVSLVRTQPCPQVRSHLGKRRQAFARSNPNDAQRPPA